MISTTVSRISAAMNHDPVLSVEVDRASILFVMFVDFDQTARKCCRLRFWVEALAPSGALKTKLVEVCSGDCRKKVPSTIKFEKTLVDNLHPALSRNHYLKPYKLPLSVHIHYYYGIMGPQNHNVNGLLGPSSIMVVYMHPLGSNRFESIRSQQQGQSFSTHKPRGLHLAVQLTGVSLNCSTTVSLYCKTYMEFRKLQFFVADSELS